MQTVQAAALTPTHLPREMEATAYERRPGGTVRALQEEVERRMAADLERYTRWTVEAPPLRLLELPHLPLLAAALAGGFVAGAGFIVMAITLF